MIMFILRLLSLCFENFLIAVNKLLAIGRTPDVSREDLKNLLVVSTFLDVVTVLCICYYFPAFPLWIASYLTAATALEWNTPCFNKERNSSEHNNLWSKGIVIVWFKWNLFGKIDQELRDSQKKIINGLASRKGGRGLMKHFLKVVRLIQAKAPTKSDVKILKHFCKEVYSIARCNGIGYLVLYLKTTAVLFQQYCAHHDVPTNWKSLGDVKVATTRTGCPKIIPKQARIRIRKRDPREIKLWLSLFNLYRYLDWKKRVTPSTFKTITEPGVGWKPSAEFLDSVGNFWEVLSARFGLPKWIKTKPHLFDAATVHLSSMGLEKGSSIPSVLSTIHHIRSMARPKDADEKHWYTDRHRNIRFDTHPWTKTTVRALIALSTKWQPEIKSLLEGFFGWSAVPVSKNSTDWISEPTDVDHRWFRKPNYELFKETHTTYMGRLATLFEAAGKIRVIALVDPLTQWVLRPLHNWLFDVLRKLPGDGTFDQLTPVKELAARVATQKSRYVGSCDMTAATDRIPILLQRWLLSWPLGVDNAAFWAELLVARPYAYRWSITRIQEFKYKVGQPMGALSSWASLAITHHFLWQWAAWRSGYPRDKWFEHYAVLGDDSACSSKKVVKEYLKICSEIGVGINLSKSLISPTGSVEFAKKFFVNGIDCSPVSIGEVIVSEISLDTLIGFFHKYKHLRISDLLSLAGYKYRTVGALQKPWAFLPPRAANLLIVLLGPNGPFKGIRAQSMKPEKAARTIMGWLNSGTCGVPKPLLSAVKLKNPYFELKRQIMQEVDRADRLVHHLKNPLGVIFNEYGTESVPNQKDGAWRNPLFSFCFQVWTQRQFDRLYQFYKQDPVTFLGVLAYVYEDKRKRQLEFTKVYLAALLTLMQHVDYEWAHMSEYERESCADYFIKIWKPVTNREILDFLKRLKFPLITSSLIKFGDKYIIQVQKQVVPQTITFEQAILKDAHGVLETFRPGMRADLASQIIDDRTGDLRMSLKFMSNIGRFDDIKRGYAAQVANSIFDQDKERVRYHESGRVLRWRRSWHQEHPKKGFRFGRKNTKKPSDGNLTPKGQVRPESK